MTITLPEWFVWFLVVWLVLQAACSLMDVVLHYYQRKLAKMNAAGDEGREG